MGLPTIESENTGLKKYGHARAKGIDGKGNEKGYDIPFPVNQEVWKARRQLPHPN